MAGPETIETGYAPIKAWVRGVPVEDAARRQLFNIAALPFIHSHVAIMPDVHFGKGATVGSVIATKGAIVPAAVGGHCWCPNQFWPFAEREPCRWRSPPSIVGALSPSRIRSPRRGFHFRIC